jgi:ApbE superfamily uncharacterized protein (UPF0280 family)
MQLTHEDGAIEEICGLRAWSLMLPWVIMTKEDGSTLVVHFVADGIKRMEVGPMNAAAGAGRQLSS